MATAAPSPLASSVEKINHIMLIRLVTDGGTTVLRKIFDRFHPPSNLLANLNANYHILSNLFRRRVFLKPQWDLLFPPGGATPDSKTFDITLLFFLLTNICRLCCPLSGWHSKPRSSDTSLEANIVRVKLFRDMVVHGHMTTITPIGVDTATFNALWQEISAVLVALGLDQAEIDRLEAERWGVEGYRIVEHDWAGSVPSIEMAGAVPSTLGSSLEKTNGDKLRRQMIKEARKTQAEILKDAKSKLDRCAVKRKRSELLGSSPKSSKRTRPAAKRKRESPGSCVKHPKRTHTVKEGSPENDVLERLANEVIDRWKKLGRRLLKNDEALLDAIDKDNDTISEKAYKMLLEWKAANGSDATFRVLYDALCHDLVKRRDLAEKFCLVTDD